MCRVAISVFLEKLLEHRLVKNLSRIWFFHLTQIKLVFVVGL